VLTEAKVATAGRARAFLPGIRRLSWPAAVAAGVVALFCYALRVAGAFMAQSDGAGNMLQAWAMLHGNLLLHGWYVSDVSFYTTELPEYMLVVAAYGLRPEVVHICAALTYTLLVLGAAVVARGQAHGRAGVARAAVAVAIMLGPALATWPRVVPAFIYLSDPDHAGTALPVLVALALIGSVSPGRGLSTGRIPRGRRLWVPVAVAAVLAWALVGDPLVLVIGVAPLLLVCGARSFLLLALRRVPLAAAGYELSLTAAAVVAAIAGEAMTHLIRALGGYMVNPAPAHIVPSRDIPANIVEAGKAFLDLFSADFFGERAGPGLVITSVHLVAAILVAAGVVAGLLRFFRGDDLLAPLLAVAVVFNVAAYVLLYSPSWGKYWEIAPVFALGAALAGRLLAEPLLRPRLEPVLVAGLAAAVFAAVPPLVSARPAAPDAASLALWLERHGLRQGIAGYWQASSVTVDSDGQVTMRAVNHDYAGAASLAPYRWESDMTAFNPRTNDANFVVATAPGSYWSATVTAAEAIAKFGEPARTYRFGQYTILVWRKNLLSDLTYSF
jgi:hypothetical protein